MDDYGDVSMTSAQIPNIEYQDRLVEVREVGTCSLCIVYRIIWWKNQNDNSDGYMNIHLHDICLCIYTCMYTFRAVDMLLAGARSGSKSATHRSSRDPHRACDPGIALEFSMFNLKLLAKICLSVYLSIQLSIYVY